MTGYTSDKQAHLLQFLQAQSQELCHFVATVFPLNFALLDLAHQAGGRGELGRRDKAESGCIRLRLFSRWDLLCSAWSPSHRALLRRSSKEEKLSK